MVVYNKFIFLELSRKTGRKPMMQWHENVWCCLSSISSSLLVHIWKNRHHTALLHPPFFSPFIRKAYMKLFISVFIFIYIYVFIFCIFNEFCACIYLELCRVGYWIVCWWSWMDFGVFFLHSSNWSHWCWPRLVFVFTHFLSL